MDALVAGVDNGAVRIGGAIAFAMAMAVGFAAPAASATSARATVDDDAVLVGAQPGDWPEQGHGPRQQANDRTESAISVDTVSSLAGTWKWDAPAGTQPEQLITANGAVYVASDTNHSHSGSVTALDQSTGALRWSVATPAFSSVGYANGSLIVTYSGSPGGLIALDPATGATRWQLRTRVFIDQALIAPGMIFMVEEMNRTSTAVLVAVDPRDGHVVWHRGLGGKFAAARVAWYGNVLYAAVGLGRVKVVALDDRSGAVLWSTKRFLAGSYAVGVEVNTRGIFVLMQPNDFDTTQLVSAFSRHDGSLLWQSQFEFVHTHVPSAALSGDTIFVRDESTSVTSHTTADGAQRWQFTDHGGPEIALANGVVFVGEDSAFVALDAATGAQLLRYSLGGTDFLSDLVVSHGAVIVASGYAVTSLAPSSSS